MSRCFAPKKIGQRWVRGARRLMFPGTSPKRQRARAVDLGSKRTRLYSRAPQCPIGSTLVRRLERKKIHPASKK